MGDRPLTLDGILATAARKVSAETGVDIPRDATTRIVRAIRPISSPHTLHAWTCTYTVHIALTVSPPPPWTPDVPGATWHDGDELLDRDLPRLWPDHRRALLAAID
ncbi:hypothetical protein [Amycolatopsis sp. lyj-112]|uniref:hypothetical protein n=1 Tax=Amycolatopsis sp. lyj-112 TaxID=2789288 RepID=UPI00397D59D0